MTMNQVIFKNIRYNIKSYLLYIVSLIFSVAICVSFMMIKEDHDIQEHTNKSFTGSLSFDMALFSIFMIVTIFLLYSNYIFIKKRSKEIGMLQVVGLTPKSIFYMLAIENIIIYISSLSIGVFSGFLISRLMNLFLLKIIDVESVVSLSFNINILIYIFAAFLGIFLVILIQNIIFLKKSTLIDLLKSKKPKNLRSPRLFTLIYTLLSIIMIVYGFYMLVNLLATKYSSITSFGIVLLSVIISIILGTYLFFRSTISFLLDKFRKSQQGAVGIKSLLSYIRIIYKIKSHALFLTIISLVSSIAIALLTLMYMTYYAIQTESDIYISSDYLIYNNQDNGKQKFISDLKNEKIDFQEQEKEFLDYKVDFGKVFSLNIYNILGDIDKMEDVVISDKYFDDINVKPGEAVLSGQGNLLKTLIKTKLNEEITLYNKDFQKQLIVTKYEDNYILSPGLSGAFPAIVVNDSDYKLLSKYAVNKGIQYDINITNTDDLEKSNSLYMQIEENKDDIMGNSKYDIVKENKISRGVPMFIVGFLGVIFLLTTGCILYFRQIEEAQEEQANFSILKKLGYNTSDILKGIYIKQALNFGIPLFIGIMYSIFIINAVWFIFGTQIFTPMIIVLSIYTAIYSIFAILSINYYQNVINNEL